MKNKNKKEVTKELVYKRYKRVYKNWKTVNEENSNIKLYEGVFEWEGNEKYGASKKRVIYIVEYGKQNVYIKRVLEDGYTWMGENTWQWTFYLSGNDLINELRYLREMESIPLEVKNDILEDLRKDEELRFKLVTFKM